MGHLLRTATHLTKLPNGHLARLVDYNYCDAADYAAAPACIKINGYIDGDLVASDPGCDCGASGQPAWDGEFRKVGYRPDQYLCGWGVHDVANGQLSMDSQTFFHHAQIHFVHLPAFCKWTIDIRCNAGQIVWGGIKVITPHTPLGVYARSAGCDPTANLTIVAC